MEGDIYVSDHAVERFVKRHVPHMTFAAAKTLLIRRARNAVALKEKTIKGDHQWRISDPNVILVGKYDRNRIICKTVLPDLGVPEEEMDLILEHIEEDERVSLWEQKLGFLEKQLYGQLTQNQIFELEKQRISAENKIDMLRLQIMREYIAMNQRRITDSRDTTSGKKKTQTAIALRETLRFIKKLVGNKEAEHVLAEVQRINPEFLTDGFLGKL